MSNWKKTLDQHYEKFIEEARDGVRFTLYVVPAWELGDLEGKCERGDEDAINIIGSINSWFDTVNEAVKEDAWPGCASCDEVLHKGEVGGFVVFKPDDDHSSIGMCGGICRECIELGADPIAANAIKMMKEHFGGEVMLTQ